MIADCSFARWSRWVVAWCSRVVIWVVRSVSSVVSRVRRVWCVCRVDWRVWIWVVVDF